MLIMERLTGGKTMRFAGDLSRLARQLRLSLPILGIGATLVLINAGLYGPLAPRTPSIGGPAAPCAYAAGFEQAHSWLPFAGDWAVVDGMYVQRVPLGFDRGTGLARFRAGERYSLSVRMRWLSGVMGAGLAFNLERPYVLVNGQLVRFTGESSLWWGYYDERSVFHATGRAFLPDDMHVADGGWHTLRLDVHPETFDVTVDGVEIAHDQVLRFTAGYLGLVTSESAVVFDDLCVG